MNKQELIDKAVLALDGKLMQHGDKFVVMDLLTKTFVTLKVLRGHPDPSNSEYEFVCHAKDFTTRARELGWINGYKYGVEYPTNGKKPDLQDDVCVQIKECGTRLELNSVAVDQWVWHEGVTHFRIVDKRYKPKETEPQSKPSDGFLEAATAIKKMGDALRKSDNSRHERGELLAVGVECEVSNCGNDFEWCKIKYIGSSLCVVDHKNYDDQHYHLSSVKFRPIPTERELLIDIIISTGNLSEGDLADAILTAGFTNNKGEIN